MTLCRPAQVRDFVRGVGERVCPRIFLDRKIRVGQSEMVESYPAFEPQFRSGPVERADRDGVAEDIVHPADLLRRRADHHPCIEQPHVVAVPWPEHKPVVSEPDRLGIAVDGHVVDLEDSHDIHTLEPEPERARAGHQRGAVRKGSDAILPHSPFIAKPDFLGRLDKAGSEKLSIAIRTISRSIYRSVCICAAKLLVSP